MLSGTIGVLWHDMVKHQPTKYMFLGLLRFSSVFIHASEYISLHDSIYVLSVMTYDRLPLKANCNHGNRIENNTINPIKLYTPGLVKVVCV